MSGLPAWYICRNPKFAACICVSKGDLRTGLLVGPSGVIGWNGLAVWSNMKWGPWGVHDYDLDRPAWESERRNLSEGKPYDTPIDDHYIDERYCNNCNQETEHRCKDSGHERDSSGDYQECLVCGEYKFGG